MMRDADFGYPQTRKLGTDVVVCGFRKWVEGESGALEWVSTAKLAELCVPRLAIPHFRTLKRYCCDEN